MIGVVMNHLVGMGLYIIHKPGHFFCLDLWAGFIFDTKLFVDMN